MSCKLDIPLQGTSLKIVKECGSPLSAVLQSKFGCEATFHGVDFERDPSTAPQRSTAVVQEKRFSATLGGGVQVSVWKADLTTFQADAVVNAANERLQHGGGLALALSIAGGPQIQRDSADHVSRYGALKTGDAIALDAGNLPCKKIIHAVGPWLSRSASQSDRFEAERLLEKAINSILDSVKKDRLQSVAIPAISSGLFNYPLPECANTIVRTVKRYYESAWSSGHRPKEIFLVNHDDPTVSEMERAARKLLASSSNGKGNAKTSTHAVQFGSVQLGSVQLGSVQLTLKKGNIEEQQTDVIVNTMSTYRDLSQGKVSHALLQKAGRGMQEEIKYAPFSGKHVITTKPYNLKCKKVYHTSCPLKGEKGAEQDHRSAAGVPQTTGALAKGNFIKKKKSTGTQILLKSISECLWLAAANNYKSITFPAIGTGGLGFGKKEVAQIMSDAVVEFAQKYPQEMEVYLVIFPADEDTFKAFKEKMGQLQKKASGPTSTKGDNQVYNRNVAEGPATSSSPAFEHRDYSHGGNAPKPQISLTSASNEATHEAERWLSDLLSRSSGPVTIYNNFVQHFGEQQHLQLSRLMKGGVDIEEVFENGRAGIIVNGDRVVEVVVAALHVEAMLCTIQMEFASEEEDAMIHAAMTKNVSSALTMVDNTSQLFLDRLSTFGKQGLRIQKVDRVENSTLKMLFDLKKDQLRCSTPPRSMLQRIPAQFCRMVSHIGFHSEYAPPDDPKYGEGIYFASEVQKALDVWKVQKEHKEEYLYFVEAEVLTGNSTLGKPGLILPPAVGNDPRVIYDSVSGGPDVSVIFSGYQALPKYIITCKRS